MLTERQEEMIYYEGYRRGKAERHKMLDDGTLVVSVDDATKVSRVLVEDEERNGSLYYADRPKGEWMESEKRAWGASVYKCSECGEEIDEMPTYWHNHKPMYKFCPYCGATMRGDGNGTD